MAQVKVASVEDVALGKMKQVDIDGEVLALYHTADGNWYATSDVCTHAGESLSTGTLTGSVVACPKHGGKFDVITGAAVAMPCVVPVEKFAVEVRNGEVYIDFD